MRSFLKLSDIHSIRKYLLHQVTRDSCLAERYSRILSFQLPRKDPRDSQSTPKQTCLRYYHPKKSSNLYRHVSAPDQLLSDTGGSFLHRIENHSDKKRPHTDMHIDYQIFRSTVISTVLHHQGDHGVHSELHHYTSDKEGNAQRSVKQNIVVDFSSPNIAKPFHAGHLRSTVIGNFIANIHKALGHNVTKINYLGDWGTQFGLLTTGYRLYGSEAQLSENAIQHLYELYVKMNKLAETDYTLVEKAQQACLDLEKDDPELLSLWGKFRDCSIDNYSQIYKRLGVEFDVHEWESEQHTSAKRICESLIDNGQLEQRDGAYRVRFTNIRGKEEEVVLLKSNGSTLYISRDIATLLSRYEKYRFDKIMYVVENGQSTHFSHLGDITNHLNLLPADGDPRARLRHIKFGRVNGMSTRKGTAVLLSDILDEARDRMIEKMKQTRTTQSSGTELEEIADKLSTTAVIVYDLHYSRTSNYTFNWDNVLSFTGDTGPFLQITHARLCSLEKNCGVELNTDTSLDTLVELESVRLITHLAKYDEAIQGATAKCEACVLVTYLCDLCHLSNAAFKKLTVKGQEETTSQDRLLMFHCARLTLANGLRLLGITPIDCI